jgi:exodeoxyribonuclease VII small subunit
MTDENAEQAQQAQVPEPSSVDENAGYARTKGQLDEIVKEVRRKDVSLEKSLELLEEGVRLANRCTELIDQAAWEEVAADGEDEETQSSEEETSAGEDAEKKAKSTS